MMQLKQTMYALHRRDYLSLMMPLYLVMNCGLSLIPSGERRISYKKTMKIQIFRKITMTKTMALYV